MASKIAVAFAATCGFVAAVALVFGDAAMAVACGACCIGLAVVA